jgi:hypothetical protein
LTAHLLHGGVVSGFFSAFKHCAPWLRDRHGAAAGLTRCVFDSPIHGVEPKAFCIDLDNDSNNCGTSICMRVYLSRACLWDSYRLLRRRAGSCGAACADAAPIDDGESTHAISNAPSVCKAGVCQCPEGKYLQAAQQPSRMGSSGWVRVVT